MTLAQALIDDCALHLPGFFKVWREPENNLLLVLVSITVRPADRVYEPVRDYVARLGAVPVASETVRTDEMAFGRATLLTYRLPGPRPAVAAPVARGSTAEAAA